MLFRRARRFRETLPCRHAVQDAELIANPTQQRSWQHRIDERQEPDLPGRMHDFAVRFNRANHLFGERLRS